MRGNRFVRTRKRVGWWLYAHIRWWRFRERVIWPWLIKEWP